MTTDLTLDEMRLALADDVAGAAAFDGWSLAAVESAAAAKALDPAVARLAFAGGAMAMIGAWVASIDAAMATALPAEMLAKLPVRERIRQLVQFRLSASAKHPESLRRALAIMAMPQNLAAATKLGWSSADKMWRLAGDVATDYNHYTKRSILGGVYAACLAVLVDDQSDGNTDTSAFLDRRIDGIMRFEKAKAKWTSPNRAHFSMARLLGRLRYPAV